MKASITDVTKFKSVFKQVISVANTSGSDQVITLSLDATGSLTISTIPNNDYAVKMYMKLDGGVLPGTCNINVGRLQSLVSRIPSKCTHLKIEVVNNSLTFTLLGLGSVGESTWAGSINTDPFIDEANYIVLDEENTWLTSLLVNIAGVAKNNDNSISIKGDSMGTNVSGKFGVTNNNYYVATCPSMGILNFALKPNYIDGSLKLLGPSVMVGYNSTNKWLMLASEHGCVCYKSLDVLGNVDKTVLNIMALPKGGRVVMSRQELESAIAFHKKGDYLSLATNSDASSVLVSNVDSKTAASIDNQNSIQCNNFEDTMVEVQQLINCMTLTNNSCTGVAIEQRIGKIITDDIIMLAISSPDTADVNITTVMSESIP